MPAVCAALIFALTLALAAPVHADATNDLFRAAIDGTASEVNAALSAGADPAARDIRGMTPLHFATELRNPNPAVIAALIEAGADPDARDEHGMTPLHMALRFNDMFNSNAAVIAALIEAGADPAARDGNGKTPLHYAAQPHYNAAAIAALIEAGADPGMLCDERCKNPVDPPRPLPLPPDFPPGFEEPCPCTPDAGDGSHRRPQRRVADWR